MIRLIKNTFINEDNTKNVLCDFIKNAKQLSMGKKVLEFEEKFSNWQDRKYSVMFNSGSSANLALITSLKNLELVNDNDNVGFSTLTWATNVMPLTQNNLNVVPIDIDLNCLNVTNDTLLETLKTKKLKMLFLTNLLGFAGDIELIKKTCKENDIIFIEDNCESLGSEVNNKKLGNFGLASTFSFFVGHHLSTIEGGMVCTDDKDLFDMLKMVRAHGWSRNLDNKKASELKEKYSISDFKDKYTFYYNSYNLRPTEINAVIGIEQLKYIDDMNNIREENFKTFRSILRYNEDIIQLEHPDMFVSNFAYPLIFKSDELFDIYKKKFEDNDIEIRPIVGGNILEQPFYKGDNINILNNAKTAFERGFYFPNNPELTEDEIKKICNILI